MTAGVLGALESTPQYRYAANSLGQGPQKIVVKASDDWDNAAGAHFTARDLDELAALPGVRAVIPRHAARAASCTTADGACPTVFVGTCAELATLMTQSGCTDDAAAWVDATNLTPSSDWLASMDVPREEGVVALMLDEDGPGATETTVAVDGPGITQDLAATEAVWTYGESIALFVPTSLVAGGVGQPPTVELIADGGMEVRQAALDFGAAKGFLVWPYPTDDYDEVQAVRAVLWTLSAIGTGLVALALTAVDRALERRRSVARQVAIGMPAHTFRASQLLQLLVPLLVSFALAFGCGLLLLRGYVALTGMPDLVPPSVLVGIGAAAATGSLVVSALTALTVRGRITPDLLRQE